MWRLSLPAIGHMVLVTLVFVVDRILLGYHGADSLASLHLSTTLCWTAYSLFGAIAIGTLAIVGRLAGAGDHAAAAAVGRASTTLACLVGVGTAALLFLVRQPLLALLFPHADANIVALADRYLVFVLPALPFAFVEAAAAACLQGGGDTRTPLKSAAIGNGINLALSVTLVFGAFGLPELGVAGAAIGSAMGFAVQAVILVAVLWRKGLWRALPDRTSCIGEFVSSCRRIMRVSAAACAEKFVYHAGYLAFVALVALLGAQAMAANQALLAVEALSCAVADGFGIAAGTLMAQHLGAGYARRAQESTGLANGYAVVALACFGLLILVARPFVSSVADGASDAMNCLVIAALTGPVMAYATVSGMALRGAGATRTVLAIVAIGSLVVRPVASLLLITQFGLAGIWFASSCDWLVRAALFGLALHKGAWRSVVV